MSSMEHRNQNERIVSLQALRAIGAILIFLHHSGLRGSVVEAFGDCGVNWFFVLSGFVLAAGFGFPYMKPGTESWRDFGRMEARFVTGRFRRVAPMYYVAMLLMVMIFKFHPSLRATVWQGVMLQSWVTDENVYFGLNGPAWFISDIMLCYAMFLPLLILRAKMPKIFRGVLFAWLVGYIVTLWAVPAGSELYWIYVFPPMQVPSFVLGMLLWSVANRLRGMAFSSRMSNLILAGSVGIVVAALLGYRMIPMCLRLSAYWWVPTSLLIVALTITDSTRCVATSLLHWKPIVVLGNASYIFFILHVPWIMGTRVVMRYLGVELPLEVELPVSILLLAVISVGIQRWMKRLKMRLN
ncbi:MAG: acyltransferase [Muribaculaceae bacterium]|nr:acyltransferase [Muribaculaceae bacterium]